jgi:hypothetical protein
MPLGAKSLSWFHDASHGKRRGHGEDSIYWDASRNQYIGAVDPGLSPDGTRIRKKVSGKTKAEVRDKLRDLHKELDAGLRPAAGRSTPRIDLISGAADGIAGPALNNWPISGTLITLEPGRSLEHPLPGRDRAFFYVLSGEVTVADRPVRAGQVAWSDPCRRPLRR